jgi:dihydroorotase-like cyclic amidohydrolase
VVNHDQSFAADVLLSGGVITAIGRSLTPPPGARVLNATGLLVMPGALTPACVVTCVRRDRTGAPACAAGCAGHTAVCVSHALD